MDLDTIYIRVQVNGNWESSSLEELRVRGEYEAIHSWFIRRINDMIEYNPEYPMTTDSIERIVELLEYCGVPIYRVRC